MADELNIPTHRWYQPRYNISLPNSDFSKQWIFNSGIQKIDAFIGGGFFSPSALFALAEPGVWFDPSDLTTLFTDPAGTTPVTAPGNTVGLMLDKSKGLALGAELVANGTFDSGVTGWSAGFGRVNGTFTASGGVATLTQGSSDTNPRFVTALSGLIVGNSYRLNFTSVGQSGSGDKYVVWTNSSSGTGGTTLNQGGAPNWGGQSLTFLVTATATTMYVAVGLVSATTGASVSIDNISVRELAGNHATQATLAARPTYSIEPVGGRRNLLTYSEQFDVNAAWNVGNTASKLPNTEIAPDGTLTADTITYGTGTSLWFGYDPPLTLTAGQPYTFSVWIKRKSGTGQLQLNIDPYSLSWNNVAITSSWQRFSITQTPTSTGAPPVICGLLFVASAADEIYIWGAQLELGSTATAYQRVTTPRDVTEAGVASVGYLYFDGAGDFMFTSTITPGTDKAQVFAGVRKLSDALGVLAEFSSTIDTNNGTFVLAPSSAGYLFASKGTVGAFPSVSTGYAAPVTNVLTGLGDISGDRATLRANGTQVVQSTADQGTGNYLAYPLFIGSRGNAGPPYTSTSLPFLGHLYSLITRFGPTLDAPTITSTEIWVGDKTGIDIAKNISTTIYTRSGETILDRANSTIERRAV